AVGKRRLGRPDVAPHDQPDSHDLPDSMDTDTSTVGIGHSLRPRKTGTAALSSGVMPRRLVTLAKVFRRTRKSTARETLSTYHTSYSNFSSHVAAARSPRAGAVEKG